MNSHHTYLFYFLSGFFLLLACSDPAPQQSQQSLPELYEQAMTFVAQSKLDSAQILFGQIVQRDSTQYTALLGLAEIHMRMRRIEKAIPLL